MQKMQMHPRDGGYMMNHQIYSVEENLFDGGSYDGGSAMHMMKQPNYHCIPKHGHNPNHGHVYGGYNEHESHVAQQYHETWHEEDWRRDGWGVKNDHSGHGGGNRHYYNNMGEYPHREGGMKYGGGGGYGGHQGHFGPHKEFHHEFHREEMKKAPPVWKFKGIVE